MAEEVPLSAGEIYTKIHGGPGEPKLSAAQEAATDLANELHACSWDVVALGREINEGWQGEAGDAAANAAMPLAEASGWDATHLTFAGTAVTDQITAFGAVRNSVVPVADSLPDMEPADIFEPRRYEERLLAYEAQARANVQAFAAYHQASTANAETVPASYYSLSDPGAPIALADTGTVAPGKGDTAGVNAPGTVSTAGSVRPPAPSTPTSSDGGPVVGPSRQQRPDVRAAATPPAGTGSTPGTTGSSAAAPPGTSGADGGSRPDDGTHAANYTPQPVNPPTPPPDAYQFGPTGKPINHLNTGTGPWAPPNPYTNTGTGTGTGTGTPGTGTGTRGGYGGTVWRGGTPGFGQVPGQTPGQPPASPGRGSGAALPGEPVARGGTAGTTGAAGARGTAGMPLGAVGGGRGREEDKERQPPPYLRNPDPDDTFAGPPQRTTPPVVGERRPDTRTENTER